LPLLPLLEISIGPCHLLFSGPRASSYGPEHEAHRFGVTQLAHLDGHIMKGLLHFSCLSFRRLG